MSKVVSSLGSICSTPPVLLYYFHPACSCTCSRPPGRGVLLVHPNEVGGEAGLTVQVCAARAVDLHPLAHEVRVRVDLHCRHRCLSACRQCKLVPSNLMTESPGRALEQGGDRVGRDRAVSTASAVGACAHKWVDPWISRYTKSKGAQSPAQWPPLAPPSCDSHTTRHTTGARARCCRKGQHEGPM